MPTKLNNKIIGSVTHTGFPGTGESTPKYNTITTAINSHRNNRNFPCVIR